MDPSLKEDLRLSHAFINTAAAGLEGFYVYVNVRSQLWEEKGAKDLLPQVASWLDTARGWWREFAALEPLIRRSQLDEPPDPFLFAWNRMQYVKEHLQFLVKRLAATSRLPRLLEDPKGLAIRVAAICQTAYSRDYFIKGLVRYGEVMDQDEVADRWRQHLLSSQNQIRRAHEALEKARPMLAGGGSRALDEIVIEEILSETLNLPAVFAQQIMDLNEVMSLVGAGLRYDTADIPEAEVDGWRDLGFSPGVAGRWYGIGAEPAQAAQWIRAGVAEPVAAFDFMLRGFSAEDAATWFLAGYCPRDAAVHRRGGVTHPDELKRPA